MKQITMYECEHCRKVFRTPNRHICRKKPEYKNCYTCAHWGHCFSFIDNNTCDYSCFSEKACKVNGQFATEAYEVMRSNGWQLNCKDWQSSKDSAQ